jgi:DNA-binding IclR family transcriptional regulator
MKQKASIDNLPDKTSDRAAGRGGVSKSLGGAQTLVRGLDVLTAVANGNKSLQDLSEALGLTRSTTHRLATTLVEQRFLNFTPRVGYRLGPKLLELGHLASKHMSLTRVVHDCLEQLAAETGDTAHLGILDHGRVLYLDKVAGSRRIEVSSRIGERQPLRSTGLGKALLLDEPVETLRRIFETEAKDFPGYTVAEDEWLQRMKGYAAVGYALDLEENEDRIRCVAAPIRDAANHIIGAISVSSAAQYMDDARMKALTAQVIAMVRVISADFGWTENYLKS